MLKIPMIEPSAASPAVAESYADFKTKMGFPEVPNFIKVQGASAEVVRGTWALVRNILVEGLLPRTLKEMVFVAISKDRNCNYCEAAHLACCRMLGVDPRILETLLSNIENITPEAAREVIRFSVKCAREPQSLTVEDFDMLKSQGFIDSEITEVVAMAGLAVYANIIADAMGIPSDEMFGNF